MSGQQLVANRYDLGEELGRGGMGVVYRAHDTVLKRDVAVKLLSQTGLGTEGRARLLAEARTAAGLNHPNIVTVHDAGELNRSPYIVMELIQGPSLHEKRPQQIDEIVDITLQICAALSHAHSQGIVHRDLKPENVLLAPDGTAKLMDFGLARSMASRLTAEGTITGTVFYMAPELALGQPYDGRADLYSLGVMLYELTSGQLPFSADDPVAVISQHLHAPVVPPSAYNEEISAGLDELIVSLLSKRPGTRPKSAAALREALETVTLADTGQPPAAVTQLNRLVRGRMIGREKEFAEAVALWQTAATGQGQLLLISGEPGIGKTRLVQELDAYAEISGGKTLIGNCFAEERMPYGPIAQMIQASLEVGRQAERSIRAEPGFSLDLPQPVLADLLTLSSELRLAFPEVPANERLDPDAEQQRLFESILAWMKASTEENELLLVVDDVHWADSGSLSLLRYLSRRLARHRMLVVATYREVELDESQPFQQLLRDLNRERLASRIKLTRLDRDGTRQLMATLFAEEITPELLDGIYRETEGNPFFVEEVCKSLVDRGKIYFEAGRWHRPDDIADLEIPQGIRSTIQARLSKLSAEERSMLQTAALLGRQFEYEMLLAVADLDEDSLIDALESGEKAQLIEELKGRFGPASRSSGRGPIPTFGFTHALIHSTLISDLSTLRRQRMQRRVAQALEKSFPDRRQELAPLLGRYFAEAGDGERAVTYLLMAGDAARDAYAYDEAIEAYEQALLFLREEGQHERAARTLMKLGLVQHNIFNFQASRQAYEEGFAEWQLAGDLSLTGDISRTIVPHPFRIAGMDDPLTLDPAFSGDDRSQLIICQLFSNLLELTAEDELVPDVAHSWELLDQGRTYIFHLRDDVIWSDGTPLTAGDFEYSWKRLLRPDNDRGLPELLFVVKGARDFHRGRLKNSYGVGVSARDDHTLIVNLEAPCSYFLQLLATDETMPVPRHVVERHGADWTEPSNIVTNGPFVLESRSPGRSLTLARYSDYHGRFKGNTSNVEISFLSGAGGMKRYEADELDFYWPYGHGALQDERRFVQRHPDEYVSIPNPRTGYLAINVTQPPFDNRTLRQAMVLAIDRETLANRVGTGLEFPAGGGMVPPGVPGHVPDIALPYDPELARQKLAEAGFAKGAGLPPISGFCGLGFALQAEHMAGQWRAILGLEVAFEALEFNDQKERLRHERPTLVAWGWAPDYLDPDTFLRVAVWRQYSGWRHERYEALVQDAGEIADQSQRMAMYRQAEQILIEEVPVVPLIYARIHMLLKPWIPSLPASLINGPIFKDVVIEPH